jgi:16S rRNA (guanine527-N7)-methyltransferase
MDKLHNGARALGIDLSQRQKEQFEGYYRELIEWNRKINLTRITDYEEVQVKHFLDSLSILPYLQKERDELSVIDIGTGAGLPGIPLKIARPGIKLTLLEATTKKARFLQYVIEKLGLRDIETVTGRAEDIAHKKGYREKYDLALSRAVAELPVSVELALPFCTKGGMFIAQKKGDIEQEIRQAAKAIAEMGGKLHDIKPIEIDELKEGRKLVIIDKVELTPEKYPRRAGIPAKRPII